MKALTREEAYDVIHMVKGGIPTFYVENVVVPTLCEIPVVVDKTSFHDDEASAP